MVMTANRAWLITLKELLSRGNSPTPLHIKGALGDTHTTHEVLNHTLTMEMAHPHVTLKTRSLPLSYAASEALMILCGSNNLHFNPEIKRTLEKWAEDSFYIKSAYGPKFVDQIPYVIRTFKQDINSRRAYVNIWRESPAESKDTTCLVSLQYFIRYGQLHCIANMRSSDAYLGLPNDIAVFSYLSFAVLLMLNQELKINLEIGKLYCNAGSRHIYAKDLEKVSYITNNEEDAPFKAPLEFVSIRDLNSWLKMMSDQVS